MPELPEVETIRRQLSKKIIGKKINDRKIVDLRRRAKILIIDFNDGSRLIFNDVRKFGWYKIVKNLDKIEKSFGPEALKVNFKTFKTLLNKRANSKIKPLLMDQKFIAGIGNIYSDEILFASKMHPLRLVKTLDEKEIKKIYQNIKKILKKAIKYHGSSVEYYLDACGKAGNYAEYHRVYQRDGKKCSRCDTIIKRIKIGGRSSHFCPQCQK